MRTLPLKLTFLPNFPPIYSCKLLTLTQTAGQAISLVVATWLLVLRVLALYSGNRVVAIALYFVFISTHVTTIVVSAIIIKELWGECHFARFKKDKENLC